MGQWVTGLGGYDLAHQHGGSALGCRPKLLKDASGIFRYQFLILAFLEAYPGPFSRHLQGGGRFLLVVGALSAFGFHELMLEQQTQLKIWALGMLSL